MIKSKFQLMVFLLAIILFSPVGAGAQQGGPPGGGGGGLAGEVAEPGLAGAGERLGACLDVVTRPLSELISGVASGTTLLALVAHVVDAVSAVGPVVVHHVAEHALEMVDAPAVRRVGFF